MSGRSEFSCGETADVQVAVLWIAEILKRRGEMDMITEVMQRLADEVNYPSDVVEFMVE